VLDQEFPASDREIIVVDDGSTDGTSEIAQRFIPHIRYIRKANGGQGSAFNAGIPECRGELVAFLDGDDWWDPSKLRRVVPVFASSPEVVMVGHGTITVSPDGSQHRDILSEGHRFSIRNVQGAMMFRLRKSFLGTRATVRTSVLRKILPVPESIRIEADEFVFTMAAAFGDVEILPEALFFYRLHSNNLYSQQSFDKANVMRKQKNIAQLAQSLAIGLKEVGVSDDILQTIVHAVQVEADHLRLSAGHGSSRELVKTELEMYRLLHSDASWTHRLFKYATLLPAYVVPPRFYCAFRRRLISNQWYLEARKVLFPVPQLGHVKRLPRTEL
jgi:glycosyltransferase involved in cell wall biosynthesis